MKDKNFGSLECIKSVPVIKIREASYAGCPMFTIAIPTYKRRDLLKVAVDSALQFSEKFNYDVIVVDNNPERGDDTELLMESIESDHLSYYKNSENIGMTGNWNRLFLLARGEWVIMLHDDDILYPNYLSVISKLITNNSKVDFIMPKAHQTLNPQDCSENIQYYRLREFDFAICNNVAPPSGMCFKRDVLLSLGGYDNSYYPSQDFHFNVKAARHAYAVRIKSPITWYYRISVNCSMKKSTLEGFLTQDSIIINEIYSHLTFLSRRICKWYRYNFKYRYIETYKRVFCPDFPIDKIKNKDNFLSILYKKIVSKLYGGYNRLRVKKI